MNPIRRYLKNKRGINTILAALLMVVIVVVASVMVYAWSTGLLGALMGGTNQNVGKEALTMDQYSFPGSYNATLYIRNAGSVSVSLQAYYVKDSAGNTWQLTSGWNPAAINPNNVLAVNIAIGAGSGQCGSTCTYSGAYTGVNPTFSQFLSSNSYTIQVVTTRGTQFQFSVTR